MNIPKNIFRGICIGCIKVYQRVLSPFLPQSCRYHPSCSEYALQAINEYGLCNGGFRALRRLCRCHPWGGGGLDPLPIQRKTEREQQKSAVDGYTPLMPADRESRRIPANSLSLKGR